MLDMTIPLRLVLVMVILAILLDLIDSVARVQQSLHAHVGHDGLCGHPSTISSVLCAPRHGSASRGFATVAAMVPPQPVDGYWIADHS